MLIEAPMILLCLIFITSMISYANDDHVNQEHRTMQEEFYAITFQKEALRIPGCATSGSRSMAPRVQHSAYTQWKVLLWKDALGDVSGIEKKLLNEKWLINFTNNLLH